MSWRGVEYITGCNQVLVSPPVKEDGILNPAQWFDVDRMEITDAEKINLGQKTANGSDLAAPVK